MDHEGNTASLPYNTIGVGKGNEQANEIHMSPWSQSSQPERNSVFGPSLESWAGSILCHYILKSDVVDIPET